MSNEESYLVPPTADPEKVWCQINEKGELNFVDWDIVNQLADQFDATPPENRTESMLIGKLMLLVRRETRKECGYDD